jgi:hypothetical protein
MNLLLLALLGCLPPMVEPTTLDNPRHDFDGDGETEEQGDCDDADPTRNTGTVWYDDLDHDGFGERSTGRYSCEQPERTVADFTDCDDTRDDVFPGAQEGCTGEDLDCDGLVSEDVPWYLDADGDAYGDPTKQVIACEPPDGYVANSDDCRDADEEAYPGADETCNDLDDDCDETVDEDATDRPRWYPDDDGDGFGDDGDAGTLGCDPPGAGWVDDNTDCDDSKSNVHPGAAETNALIDEDCDGDILS